VGSDEDTIVALASAPGRAAVAIVRISGSSASKVGAILGFELPRPRLASVRKLRHAGTELDQALVLFFKGPGSYTGEDLVELHIHGGKASYDSVLSVLLSVPHWRHAEPGEFSRRAVLNGRLDLTAAEAVNDLVNAETEAQRELAMMQLGGSLRGVFEDWAEKLTGIRAHLEAYIDFPDEEIPSTVLDGLCSGLVELIDSMTAFMNDGRRGERLREGLRIAVVGPPNAGKSSFVNWLAERDVAIVSEQAGTTRDVIEVHLDLEGYPVTVADTAGLREEGGVVEIEGMRRARQWADNADLRILVVDVTDVETRDPTQYGLREGDLVLFNKVDLSTAAGHKRRLKDPGRWDVEHVSVSTGEGLADAMKVLSNTARSQMDVAKQPVISRSRHRAALRECVVALEGARAGLSTDLDLEIVAEEMRRAADDLGRVTGRVDVEDLLDVVFRDFCIGK